MPAHRPHTARHRGASASAARHGARHGQQSTGRLAGRYATAIGTVTTALFITFAQAPAVERATALTNSNHAANYSPATELAILGSVAQLTAEAVVPPPISPRLAAARAARDARRDPRGAGRQLAASLYGWSGRQWTCLDRLWMRESRWNYLAKNSSSGAYGIPQALPGSKMSTSGRDWRTNPVTQIRWGLKYIKGRYATPCSAWAHSESVGWY